ncbi:MAG: bifunctional diguanylate cyclase/phosphodiesterase [Pseudomonadota bacterium]
MATLRGRPQVVHPRRSSSLVITATEPIGDDLARQGQIVTLSYALATLALLLTLVWVYRVLDGSIAAHQRLNALALLSHEQQQLFSETYNRVADLKETLLAPRPNPRLEHQIRQALASGLSALRNNQARLDETIAQIDADLRAPLLAIYLEPPDDLKSKQARYVERVGRLLEPDARVTHVGIGGWIPIDGASSSRGALADSYRRLRDVTNNIVAVHGARLQRRQQLSFGVILLVLCLEALFIFRPMGQRLQRTHERVLAAQRRLGFVAHNDNATALLNAAGLEREFEQIAGAHASFDLLLVEVDNMARVSQRIGAANESVFLRDFASRLFGAGSQQGLLARVGDHEFCLLRPTDGRAGWDMEPLLETLNGPLTLAGVLVYPEACAAFVRFAPGDTSCGIALAHARIARRTLPPGPGWVTFSKPMADEIAAQEGLLIEMRRGLDQGEFIPYYQLKVDARTGAFDGMEALARWLHPDDGLVSPARFVPGAERTGLVVDLTFSLLQQIADDVIDWHSAGIDFGRVAFNASVDVLLNDALLIVVDDVIARVCGVIGRRDFLEMEITENVAMSARAEEVRQRIRALRERGITVALDDFGTGFASLSTLSEFEYDVVKIDRSFVIDIHTNAERRSIVQAVVTLCSALGKRCVAEGVETVDEADTLRGLGCDQLQGFLYARPQPASDVRAQLIERPKSARVASSA